MIKDHPSISSKISYETEISFILFTAIKGGGKDITEKQVSNMIWDVGFVDAIRACGEIISMALGAGDDEKK